MEQEKFLEEFKTIERKVRSASDKGTPEHGLLGLVEDLIDQGKIPPDLFDDIETVWEIRNRLYADPEMDVEVGREVRDSLVQVVKKLTI
jgi:hypothetical protein